MACTVDQLIPSWAIHGTYGKPFETPAPRENHVDGSVKFRVGRKTAELEESRFPPIAAGGAESREAVAHQSFVHFLKSACGVQVMLWSWPVGRYSDMYRQVRIVIEPFSNLSNAKREIFLPSERQCQSTHLIDPERDHEHPRDNEFDFLRTRYGLHSRRQEPPLYSIHAGFHLPWFRVLLHNHGEV
jgi:hypothetical protein